MKTSTQPVSTCEQTYAERLAENQQTRNKLLGYRRTYISLNLDVCEIDRILKDIDALDATYCRIEILKGTKQIFEGIARKEAHSDKKSSQQRFINLKANLGKIRHWFKLTNKTTS